MLAVAASVVAAVLSLTELALASLGAALVGVLGWLVLWSRWVYGKFMQVARVLGEIARAAGADPAAAGGAEPDPAPCTTG